MHACVFCISIHTSQRTPGVYCRRVSLNNDQQSFMYTFNCQFYYNDLKNLSLLFFVKQISFRRKYWKCNFSSVAFTTAVISKLKSFCWHKYCEHRFCLFFLTHTLIKHHEIGTVTGYTQKRVLSRISKSETNANLADDEDIHFKIYEKRSTSFHLSIFYIWKCIKLSAISNQSI